MFLCNEDFLKIIISLLQIFLNIYAIHRAFALELCLTSIDDYCKKPNLFQGIIPMPSNRKVLIQLAEGMNYIHQYHKTLHRDIKPKNVLISFKGSEMEAVIKWADLGLSKALSSCSKSITFSGKKGSERWLSPEILNEDDKGKIKGSVKSDNFSLGCVYFFYLLNGLHPFGNDNERIVTIQDRIKKGNPINFRSKFIIFLR